MTNITFRDVVALVDDELDTLTEWIEYEKTRRRRLVEQKVAERKENVRLQEIADMEVKLARLKGTAT